MKKIYFILILFLIFNTLVFGQDKERIAVMDLDAEGLSGSEARIISARLRSDLFNTGSFVVFERNKMEDILKEQGFQLSGCSSNDCIVEIGKLIGVQKIVAGNVGKIGNLITINIRLIDVESGEVTKTANDDCDCEIETVITRSVQKVAYELAEMPVSEKQKTSKKLYLAPFVGYGVTDGQKVGYGIRIGAVFGNQVKFGFLVTNHHGTDESSDGNWGYENTSKKAFYIGSELGYIFRLNKFNIYPYLTVGYVNGDYYEEGQDSNGEWSQDKVVGPIYGGAGFAIDFKISDHLNIGPDFRFTIGAPDRGYAGFLVLGILF